MSVKDRSCNEVILYVTSKFEGLGRLEKKTTTCLRYLEMNDMKNQNGIVL
jgi:hypothetical protein